MRITLPAVLACVYVCMCLYAGVWITEAIRFELDSSKLASLVTKLAHFVQKPEITNQQSDTQNGWCVCIYIHMYSEIKAACHAYL